MEIRVYLALLWRFRLLILVATLAAGTVAAALDSARTPVYQVQARIAVRPARDLPDPRTAADVIGNLTSRSVMGTFAQVFTAASVRDEARRAAGLSSADEAYSLRASVLPDSLVIQAGATGPDRVVLTEFFNAALTAAIKQTEESYSVVELLPLEMAQVPAAPVSPRPARDIPLALALGLAAGCLASLAWAYLAESRPVEATPPEPGPAEPARAQHGRVASGEADAGTRAARREG